MPETLSKEDVRELIESNPDAAIEALSQHPACTNRLHVNRKNWEYCWRLANNIAPEQIKEQREEQEAENAIPPENLKRIAEIQKTDAFKRRNHPEHRKLHREWLALFPQKGQ